MYPSGRIVREIDCSWLPAFLHHTHHIKGMVRAVRSIDTDFRVLDLPLFRFADDLPVILQYPGLEVGAGRAMTKRRSPSVGIDRAFTVKRHPA